MVEEQKAEVEQVQPQPEATNAKKEEKKNTALEKERKKQERLAQR